MRSFAVRARIEPLLFYTFDSINFAISEKSVAMLLSSPNFSTRITTGQRGAARLLLHFGCGTPVAILAYLDDFLAVVHDRSAMHYGLNSLDECWTQWAFL